MFRRRGTATRAIYAREELLGGMGREVDHEIHGTVTRAAPVSCLFHPEAYEVEVITVVRIDPDTAERVRLDPSHGAFTDTEHQQITHLLASRFEIEEPDGPDSAGNE